MFVCFDVFIVACGTTHAMEIYSKIYEKGREATDEEMKLLNIRADRTLPEWNYTIKPYTQKQLHKM